MRVCESALSTVKYYAKGKNMKVRDRRLFAKRNLPST